MNIQILKSKNFKFKKVGLNLIDGSHDFEDVNNDFNECLPNLNKWFDCY